MGTLMLFAGISFLAFTVLMVYSLCVISSPFSREEERREIKDSVEALGYGGVEIC